MKWTINDILALRETIDVEFKKAAGRDGKGSIPDSFWPTYSAFANTDGGDVFLGIEEKEDGSIHPVGIEDVARLRKDLFNLANSRQKISANLLHDQNVEEIQVENVVILRIHIPRAPRRDRPVYVGMNPLNGTYVRRHEGDYRLDELHVKRMLAEQGEDAIDGRILAGYTVDDLDLNTLAAYRNTFASVKPNHPFISQSQGDFLRSIGAWNKHRETAVEGLTLAGLLMFGKFRSILDELPNYILDYQEHSKIISDNRWIDRLTTDGSWSGNLYDFYLRVYQKITRDIKVPFKLEGATRVDESPVHEALRESLVNTLIHADFSGRVSVLIEKSPDMISFRNPGLMRVPIEQAILGGNSDCRNRNLQKMFQLIGAGEQAGSGIPKIYQNWKQQHWRNPKIFEQREPSDQTRTELHMTSLWPQPAIDQLVAQFGSTFEKLPDLERLILIITVTEDVVDHKRVKELSSEHPADISKALNNLVKGRFLITNGSKRGAFYSLAPLSESKSPVFSFPSALPNSEGLTPNSEGLMPRSEGLMPRSEGLMPNLDGASQKEMEISNLARDKKKISRLEMEGVVMQLCAVKPQTLKSLSFLLNRDADYLRIDIIKKLMEEQKLVFVHSSEPNHPDQAYRLNELV